MIAPMRCDDLAALKLQVGREVYASDWVGISQSRIDAFAEATGDRQWIHVDRERAARCSPFGGTIAHGFLSLSLLGGFYEELLPQLLPFCDVGVNYGLNKVRFTHPVPAGSRVAGRLKLLSVEDVNDSLRMIFAYTLQLEGETKPACVAESIVIRRLKPTRTPNRTGAARDG